MAKLQYHGDTKSRERGVKVLHERVGIGALGAPTEEKSLSMTLTRTAAGVYDVQLIEKFVGLISVQVTQIGALQDLTFHVTADNVSVDGTFELTCATGGVATEVSNGSVLSIKVDVKDSSVRY